MKNEEVRLAEAIDKAVSIINGKVTTFIKTEKELLRWGDLDNRTVVPYLKGLKAWMRGNIDWALESKRYRSPESPFAELRRGLSEENSSFNDVSKWTNWR